jgi:hypothetical protein
MAILAFSYFTSKPLPEGKKGIQAELLTDKIQEAINQKQDSTTAVSFTLWKPPLSMG